MEYGELPTSEPGRGGRSNEFQEGVARYFQDVISP